MPPDYSPAQAPHGIIIHNDIYIVIFVIHSSCLTGGVSFYLFPR